MEHLERGPMTGKDMARMKKCKPRLIAGISRPGPLMDHLDSHGVFLPEDKQMIDVERLPIDKVRKIIDILMENCCGSFSAFVECLRETHHFNLADLLENCLEIQTSLQRPNDRTNLQACINEPVHRQNDRTNLQACIGEPVPRPTDSTYLKTYPDQLLHAASQTITVPLVKDFHPKECGRMPEREYQKIQSNFEFLLKELNPGPLCIKLFEMGVFDEDDKDIIERTPGRKEKCDKLLMILLECGINAFNRFLTALSATGHGRARTVLELKEIRVTQVS
ncbi:hypothetical protein SNE40_006088 [Patella caerulea]|uniref:CARD domain-containing protein n=1 Tax=Patella caerulea TaxID=87958 RepID=A0AAN8K1U3_PATCE